MKLTIPREKSVITGGLGFIGSTLAEQLTNAGLDTLLVDSLIPNYGGLLHNIASFRDNPFLQVNISDIRDPFSLPCLLSGTSTIFNLAGQTSHMDSMADPFTDLDINAKAQLSLLEVSKRQSPLPHILFASTRQIYGNPRRLPVDEHHTLNPVDVNGVNKLAGEQFHSLYSRVYGIPTTIFRLTNTYGPRMRIKDSRQTFLGVWIRSILTSHQFEVWGGHQLRDFTYVDDCVDAFLLAAKNPDAFGRIYNLGGCGEPIRLLELAELLVEQARILDIPLLDRPYIIREFPSTRKKIDIGDYYADYSSISSDLSWTPRVPIDIGLRKTLEYYLNNIDHYL